jgi:uncharacterized damage-inducible protein DinB
MAISNLIKTYAEYSLYADKKIIHWLQQKPVELIDFQLPSSFSSIRKTLWHIHDTERFWLSILKGESINFDTEMPQNIDIFFAQCITQSELFTSYSTSLSDEALENTCVINQPWMKATMPKFEIIQHCINHSSYHRGQIITIARNAGISDIPMTDYAMYLVREIKKY